MWRYCNYNGLDRYCRYFNVGLYRVEKPVVIGPSATICRGAFGHFLKDRLGIQRIPCGLLMADMIVKGALIPDLFVRVPPEYFLSWRRFPRLDGSEIPQELKWVDCHNMSIHYRGEWSLESALHPYDGELKSGFVNRFSEKVPRNLLNHKHPNGVCFRPFEAYLRYWKAYIFVEALDGYEDIGLFLTSQIGREILISNFKKTSEWWEVEYKAVFDRLSFYRTATTNLTLWEGTGSTTTGKELSEFVLSVSNGTTELLERDLEKLLILFGHWRKKDQAGRRYYQHALEQLRYDVFLLLEWLCPLTGKPEEMYFEKWSRPSQKYVPLMDVISYEEFDLEDSFVKYVPHYSSRLVEDGILVDVKSIYARLTRHDSFWPWIRAFSDLHHKLVPTNPMKPLVFRQPRILDHLLVVAVRTEILIRTFFRTAVRPEEPRSLRAVIGRFSEKLPPSSMAHSILSEVSKKSNWKQSELFRKPDEIFEGIADLTGNDRWSEIQHHIFKSILRFNTARNHFAHHSFKDGLMNTKVDSLPREILVSCLDTLVYMESVVQEIASGRQRPEE